MLAQFLVLKGESTLLILEVSFHSERQRKVNFPMTQPGLTLRDTMRPKTKCSDLNGCPWSPRWSLQEMIARIFNYVRAAPTPHEEERSKRP